MKFGSAFAGFAFAFGAHPILPDVYRSMSNPTQYRTMLTGAFLIVMALYLPICLVCYSVYGSELKSPVYETAAMSGSVAIKAIVALLTVHIIGGYAIVINPPEVALESALGIEKRSHPFLLRICLRSLFVLFTCSVSVLMRNDFAPCVNLVSSFTSSFTCFILPCMFYVRLSLKAGIKLSAMELAWNLLIIVLAILGSIFGAMEAVEDIITTFFNA